jgi:hypothetical protein
MRLARAEIHCKWSDRIRAEMYAQGDTEKDLGLDVSPFCDRRKDSDRYKNQVRTERRAKRDWVC